MYLDLLKVIGYFPNEKSTTYGEFIGFVLFLGGVHKQIQV